MRDQIQELIDALNLRDTDVVLDLVLIARVADPAASSPHPALVMSATDDADFSRQLGMLHEGLIVMEKVRRIEE